MSTKKFRKDGNPKSKWNHYRCRLNKGFSETEYFRDILDAATSDRLDGITGVVKKYPVALTQPFLVKDEAHP